MEPTLSAAPFHQEEQRETSSRALPLRPPGRQPAEIRELWETQRNLLE